MHRNAGAVAAVALFLFAGLARADSAPPLIPVPPAPPPPVTPLGRALGDAFAAIRRAATTDPAIAVRADFAYVTALSRARMGDTSSALAAAALASGIAAGARAVPVTASAPNHGLGAGAVSSVPLAVTAVLSPALLAARNEIDVARQLGCDAALADATRSYRLALDADENGLSAKANAYAAEAFDRAADRVDQAKNGTKGRGCP